MIEMSTRKYLAAYLGNDNAPTCNTEMSQHKLPTVDIHRLEALAYIPPVRCTTCHNGTSAFRVIERL